MSHPLWSHFDIEFKNFNSATSYSGPAADPFTARQLRADFAHLICINRQITTAICLITFRNWALPST
ncbi:cellulose biosynthesis protein BcsG [Escherichia coli]